MTGCIVGWAHTRFGRHDESDIEALIVEVASSAIRDAGLAPADIDAVYLGTMNAGLKRKAGSAWKTREDGNSWRTKPAFIVPR